MLDASRLDERKVNVVVPVFGPEFNGGKLEFVPGGVDVEEVARASDGTSTDAAVALVGAGAQVNEVIQSVEDPFLANMAEYVSRMRAEAHKLQEYFASYNIDDGVDEALLDELYGIMAEFASVEEICRSHHFGSLIRHAMVSPVGHVSNFMDFLTSEDEVNLREEYLVVIKRAIESLIFVLDQVMPTVIEGGFKAKDVNLDRVLALVMGRMNGHAKDVELDVPEGKSVRFLSGMLFPVLENFVSNAFKYGATKVKVDLVQVAEDAVELRVHDDGPSIDEAMKKRMFADYIPESKTFGVALLMTSKMMRDLKADETISGHEHFDAGLVQSDAGVEGAQREKYFYVRMPLGSSAS